MIKIIGGLVKSLNGITHDGGAIKQGWLPKTSRSNWLHVWTKLSHFILTFVITALRFTFRLELQFFLICFVDVLVDCWWNIFVEKTHWENSSIAYHDWVVDWSICHDPQNDRNSNGFDDTKQQNRVLRTLRPRLPQLLSKAASDGRFSSLFLYSTFL